MDSAKWRTYGSVMVALGMSGDGGGVRVGGGLWRPPPTLKQIVQIVLALYACRSFTTDEDPWIGVETFGSLTNSNCPNRHMLWAECA